jgi:molybdopterin guanine dinucleotide-containing S/N-oxide reductase-like protein
MTKVVHAACPHDCPDACGVLITVDELSGKATKIQGDPTHPMTRGFLCAKVAKYLDRVYSPDRLLYPMKRIKPKGKEHFGPSAFERITWEEALNTIVAKIRSLSAEFGPESILPYSYGGTLGLLNNASMDHRFFHRIGASQLNRTICATAGGDALISVLGKKLGTEPEQFRHSKYIIAWGANIHGNNVHLWPFIEEARRNGAKFVVIDPYRTRTARVCDWHIQINPGTDVALALGMMRIIISENLHDADYVAKYTHGFDELCKRVNEDAYAPERVSQLTGIPVADIYQLAREYATSRPAVIRLNYGIQRSENGGMAARAVTMLPCITGSWKEVGGGLQLSTSGSFPINDRSLTRPDLMNLSPLHRPARVLNMSELGKVLTTVTDPPVKMVFVYNSNPASVAPNHNDVVKGFLRPDLFTVVHDQFFTDSTDYADIILPATTFFEHKELQKSYGHYYLQVSNQAIAPLGEARSNVDLFRDLALKMGLDNDDPCFRESVDEMIDGALKTEHPWLQGITRERLEKERHIRLNFSGNGHVADAETEPFLPFKNGGFPTPSGKAELYSEALLKQGLDPVACFIAPKESRHNRERAAQFPLEMLARKADNHLNTTFCNLPPHQKMEESHLLELSPADAAPRNIKNGDPVRVFNSRGEIRLTARVDGAVRPGVVAAKLNWARLAPDKQSINVLTSETLTEIGAGATFYSCLVQVERG